MADSTRDVVLRLIAKNLTPEAFNQAQSALKALGIEAQATARGSASAMATFTGAAGDAKSATDNLGRSWVARIAEGALLADVVRGVVGKIRDMIEVLPELAMQGAVVADIEESFERLTTQAGMLGTSLTGTLRTATHGTVDDLDLMTRVNENLAAGVKLTEGQFGLLAKGAFALAQATGKDVKSSFDTMNDAMLTGRTRALALLTGKIDLEHAEERYAHALGVSRDHLSDEGKMEAARQAILESVGRAVDRLGEQTDGLDEKVQQVQTTWTNFEHRLGESIAKSPVIAAGFDKIRESLTQAFGGNQELLILRITRAVESGAIVMVDFGLGGVAVAGVMVQAWGLIKTIVLGVESAIVGALSTIATVAEVATTLNAFLPSASSFTADMAKKVANLARAARETANGLADETTAAWEMAKGNSEANRTLDKLGGALYVARDAMVDAQLATAAGTTGLKAHTSAAEQSGKAERDRGLTITQTASEAAAAAKKREAAERAYAASLVALTPLEETRIRNLKLKGLTSEQIAQLTEKEVIQVNNLIEADKNQDEVDKKVQADKIARAKQIDADLQAIHERELQRAEASAKLVLELLQQITDEREEANNRQLHGLDLVLAQIQQAEDAEIASARKKFDVNSELYKELEPLIRERHQHERDLAIGTADTIQERMRAAGVETQADLNARAAAFRAAYEQMAESGDYTADQLQEQLNRVKGAEQEATGELDKWAIGVRLATGALNQFGQKGQVIGQIIQFVHQLSLVWNAVAGSAQAAAAAEAAATMGIGLALQAVMAAWQSHVSSQAQAAIDVVGDAENEVVRGTRSAVSLINAAGAEAMKVLDTVLDRFLNKAQRAGGVFSDTFKRFMEDLESAGAGSKGGRVLEDMLQKIRDIRNEQRKSGESGATQALGVTAAALAKREEDLKTLIELQKQYADATTDDERNKIQKSIDETNRDLDVRNKILKIASVETTEETDALTASIYGGIAARMANGESFVSALKNEKGAVDALAKAMEAGGVGGTYAFNRLFDTVALATDEIGGPALERLEGFRQATLALSNANMLTEAQYQALTSNIGQTVAALEAEGKEHETVRGAVLPMLQTAWELQQKFGYKVDDATQALINEAVAAGEVGEEHKSAADQMLDVMRQLLGVAERIADAFAGNDSNSLTNSIGRFGDDASGVFGRVNSQLRDLKSNSQIQFTAEGSIVMPEGGGHGFHLPEPPGFAEGTGGRFLDFGAGTLAILHGRERVVTEREATGHTFNISVSGVSDVPAMDRYLKNGGAKKIALALAAELRSSGTIHTVYTDAVNSRGRRRAS